MTQWLSYSGHDNLIGYYVVLMFYGAARAFSGLVLGGVLYAYVKGMTYAVCCLCFALDILLLFMVPILYSSQHEGPVENNTGVLQRFSEGLRFIQIVRKTMSFRAWI